MQTVDISTVLVEPAACGIYQTGRIQFVDEIGYFLRRKLPPAFIERYPCDNGRMIVQVFYHVTKFTDIFLTAVFVCAGEKVGMDIFYRNPCPVQ